MLGAGIAGMIAAYELRKAGYKVQMLEYNDRPGGRNWSLYGGDTYTESGGVTQQVQFDKGLYFNPGPWRIALSPSRHSPLLQAAERGARALRPWSITTPMSMRPRRSAASPSATAKSQADFHGYIAELLAKATSQGKLDGAAHQGREGRAAADAALLGRAGQELRIQERRAGQQHPRLRQSDPGGGLRAACRSIPIRCRCKELFESARWFSVIESQLYEYPDANVPAGGRHGHDRQGVRHARWAT